jgi:rhamnulokinase
MELDGPITTTDAQTANFTNEAGVDGRTRFLRNTGGLWLLQESLRTWTERGPAPDPTAVLAEAAVLETDGPCLDVDDPEFFAPGDMPTRIAAACGRSGARAPETPAETVRCILDSLADVYARTARDAASLARGDVDRIHIVGGGSQSELLCRRTAAVADLPVVAGPVEATVLGNVLVQARAHGVAPQSLDDIRVEMARTVRVRRFEPSGAGATR